MGFSESQEKVYRELAKSPVPINARDISERSGVSYPTVHRMLGRLELLGRIQKSSIPGKAYFYEIVENTTATVQTKAAANPAIPGIQWQLGSDLIKDQKIATIFEVLQHELENKPIGSLDQRVKRYVISRLAEGLSENDQSKIDSAKTALDNTLTMIQARLRAYNSLKTARIWTIEDLQRAFDEDPESDIDWIRGKLDEE